MSFFSSYSSPGGFSTQRLDLILQKRKDSANSLKKPSPRTMATASTSSKITAGAKDSSMTKESGSSKSGGGESALDRWRKKMAEQGKSPDQRNSSINQTKASNESSTKNINIDSSVSMSFDSVEPRKTLDFTSNADISGDQSEQKWPGRHGSMNLPRRRAERGTRLRGNWTNGTSASSTHLDRTNSMREQPLDQVIADPCGSITSVNIPVERTLTSRRFQALFSSKKSDEEEEDSNNSDDDDYPDSLEEDVYKPSDATPNLRRSASSASTVLRGTNWTPASKLLRDRYEIEKKTSKSPEASHSKTSRAPGTRSNWAAWRGDIKKDDNEVNNGKGSLLRNERLANKQDITNTKNTANVTTGTTTTTTTSTSTSPSPASIHLSSFPGYAGGVKPLEVKGVPLTLTSSGHLSDHKPQAAFGQTPAEWYLYKGSASLSTPTSSLHKAEEGAHNGNGTAKAKVLNDNGPPTTQLDRRVGHTVSSVHNKKEAINNLTNKLEAESSSSDHDSVFSSEEVREHLDCNQVGESKTTQHESGGDCTKKGGNESLHIKTEPHPTSNRTPPHLTPETSPSYLTCQSSGNGLPQPDVVTEAVIASTNKSIDSVSKLSSSETTDTALGHLNEQSSSLHNTQALLSKKSQCQVSTPATEGVEQVAIQQGVPPEELALRPPRVSFSDDLKVVPASPSPERKTLQSTEAGTVGADKVQEVEAPSLTPANNTTPGEALLTCVATKTSPYPRPWHVVGHSPVKGILQNGRKEGEVVHRPAPDDSQMRVQDDSGSESGTAEHSATPGSGAKRPVGSSQRRYMCKTVSSHPTTPGTLKGGTPTLERRSIQPGGHIGTASTTRSASMRSLAGQRGTWSSRRDSGEVPASPAVQTKRRGAQARRGSTDSLDSSMTHGHRHDTRTSMKGSTESLSTYMDRARRESSRSAINREPNRGTIERAKTNNSSKTKINQSVNSDQNRSYSRSDKNERRRCRATEADESHGVADENYKSKGTLSKPKHGHENMLDEKCKKDSEKEHKAQKDTEEKEHGFTLSFKDFMEQRKKRGTCVLPTKVSENAENLEGEGDGDPKSGRNRTQSESSTESSCNQREGTEGASVTLNSLKEIRDREEHGRKRYVSRNCASEDVNNEDVKMTKETENEPDNSFKTKDEGRHRWSFRSRKKKQTQLNSDGDNSSGSSKKDHGVGSAFSNFFKRSRRTSKRGHGNNDDGCGSGDIVVDKHHEESKTGSTGHKYSDKAVKASKSKSEISDGDRQFMLGPHGHSDTEKDPLSALFVDAKGDSNEPSGENRVSSNVTVDSPKTHHVARVDRSPVGLLLDMVGSPSNSPTLSAMSSVDEGAIGTVPSSARNRHYERPTSHYKHFLDMDSLVASITTNNQSTETPTESSSGISVNTSKTGSESPSVLGSLEDLAMALLESELREEGLLEGEPGLPEPAKDYEARIQGIKADLHKFSAHIGRTMKKHKHGDSGERTPSVSEMSVTSTRSSRSPWLRDATMDAKPISDPTLRNKLKSARNPTARVTSRDQKILELMMAKREEEKAEEKKRTVARRAWESQKQQDEAAKTSADIRRRESLVRQRQQKDLTKGRRRTDSTDSLHSTYSERGDDHLDSDEAHRYKDRQWSSQSQKIADLREKKMAERRAQNMQRKKSQEDKKRAAEDRVLTQKRDQEEMTRMVQQRQDRELKRANSLKESKEQEAIMQRKLKNYYQRKKQEDRMSDLKRKSREDIHTLQSAIDLKQTAAQNHLQAIETQRYRELRRSTSGSMTDLDTRICRSKENQHRLQEEMTAWHADLHNYRKMMEKRAEEHAKVTIVKKAKRVAEDRRSKEKSQKENFKKLLSQEEEWKAGVEASIAMKDAKTRMLQMEKDEIIHESRANAATSQRMREELRSAYSIDTIDQLSKQAQLQAKLVNAGLTSTTKNLSTLTLS